MAHKIQIPVKREAEESNQVNGPIVGENINPQMPVTSRGDAQETIKEFDRLYNEFNLVQQNVFQDLKKCKFGHFVDVIKTGEKALEEGDELMEYMGMGYDDAINTARDRIIDIEKKKNQIIAHVSSLDDDGRMNLFAQNSAYGGFTMADVHLAVALMNEAGWLPETQRANLQVKLEEEKQSIDRTYAKAVKRNFIFSFIAAFISLIIFLIVDLILFAEWTWTGYVALLIYIIKVVSKYKQLTATANFYGEKHVYKITTRALSFF